MCGRIAGFAQDTPARQMEIKNLHLPSTYSYLCPHHLFDINSMTINQIQDEIIEEFSEVDDWMDRYAMIIDLGNALPPIDEKFKTPQHLIEGCQSRVWLNAEERDGLVYYTADSDAIIVKGIIALLIKVLNGHTPEEIADANLYFIDRIGLAENLSPTRSNGLLAMVKQMRLYAVALSLRHKAEKNDNN